MRKIPLQNIIILTGFIKKEPTVESVELRTSNPTNLNKTSVYFYFFSSETQSTNSIKIVAWGKNGEDLANMPLGDFFSIHGTLRMSKRNNQENNLDFIPEILVKTIQKSVDIDDEF